MERSARLAVYPLRWAGKAAPALALIAALAAPALAARNLSSYGPLFTYSQECDAIVAARFAETGSGNAPLLVVETWFTGESKGEGGIALLLQKEDNRALTLHPGELMFLPLVRVTAEELGEPAADGADVFKLVSRYATKVVLGEREVAELTAFFKKLATLRAVNSQVPDPVTGISPQQKAIANWLFELAEDDRRMLNWSAVEDLNTQQALRAQATPDQQTVLALHVYLRYVAMRDRSTDAAVRAQCDREIETLRGDEAIARRLVGALNDGASAWVQTAVIYLIGHLPLAGELSKVLPYLASDNPRVRTVAVSTCGCLRDPASVDALAGAYTASLDRADTLTEKLFRREIEHALMSVKDDAGIPALKRVRR